MKKYLSELHKKPRPHKKRFALAVSGGFTLAIFLIWSVVKFGGGPELAQEETGPANLAAVAEADTSLFADMASGIMSSWRSLTNIDGK